MLPKLVLPHYDIKVPSTGKTIKIRPFTVREEKILLLALESGDPNDIINATLQTVQACIVTKKVNVDTMPFFDVDYLFIAMRAKSVGESIDINYTCPTAGCGHTFKTDIDITNCEVINYNNNNLIDLGNIKIQMKYPNYATMKKLDESVNPMIKKIDFIAACIDYIAEGEKIISTKDVTREELIEYIEGMTQAQYKKLEQFVDYLPSFVVTKDIKCPKCGNDNHLEYTEFESFFV